MPQKIGKQVWSPFDPEQGAGSMPQWTRSVQADGGAIEGSIPDGEKATHRRCM